MESKTRYKENFKSSHGLDFEVSDWERGTEYKRFRIGTCSGLWTPTPCSYDILAITNDEKGNGHLDDVFEWFENSCKRDKRNLRVLEVMNDKFETHLIKKRGFTSVTLMGYDHLYKSHDDMK